MPDVGVYLIKKILNWCTWLQHFAGGKVIRSIFKKDIFSGLYCGKNGMGNSTWTGHFWLQVSGQAGGAASGLLSLLHQLQAQARLTITA